jgi:hypothetical protein
MLRRCQRSYCSIRCSLRCDSDEREVNDSRPAWLRSINKQPLLVTRGALNGLSQRVTYLHPSPKYVVPFHLFPSCQFNPMTMNANRPPRILPSRPEFFLRNQLTLQSWLILGAAGQAILSLVLSALPLPVSSAYAAAPSLLIALYSLLTFVRKAFSYKPGDDGALLQRTGISFDKDEKSDGKVCVPPQEWSLQLSATYAIPAHSTSLPRCTASP